MTLRKSLRWTAGAAALALVASGCSFITRVSVASDGTQGNAGSGSAGQPHLTGNSRYSLFSSAATNLVANDTNGKIDAFRHDDTTGVTRRVSLDGLGQQINADSGAVGISDDGATVVFATTAALTAEDQNTSFDLYVKNVASGARPRWRASGPTGASFPPGVPPRRRSSDRERPLPSRSTTPNSTPRRADRPDPRPRPRRGLHDHARHQGSQERPHDLG